jgi:DNA-binding transcriptional MerR regulator
MNATQELDSAERIAREIDEIDEIERSLRSNDEARRRLRVVRRRLMDWVPAVRFSVAADLLELSVPTVRAWTERGLLEETAGPSPRRVTLKSLLEVRPALRDLRAVGRDRNLLEAVVARLEDERVLADPRLKRSLEEMHRGELIDVTPSREP